MNIDELLEELFQNKIFVRRFETENLSASIPIRIIKGTNNALKNFTIDRSGETTYEKLFQKVITLDEFIPIEIGNISHKEELKFNQVGEVELVKKVTMFFFRYTWKEKKLIFSFHHTGIEKRFVWCVMVITEEK